MPYRHHSLSLPSKHAEPAHPALRTTASTLRVPALKNRRGHLLAECLVGMLLLAAASVALSVSNRAVSLLGDDAILVNRAQFLGASAVEQIFAHGCRSESVSRSDTSARVIAQTITSADSGVRTSSISATLSFSPFARNTPPTLSVSSAFNCR